MSGFYRLDTNGELLGPCQEFTSPSGYYSTSNKDGYTYPIDGAWGWYAGDTEAATSLAPGKILNIIDFLARFTKEERINIFTAATENNELRDNAIEMLRGDYIRLNNPRVIQVMDGLVEGGLLEGVRREQILSSK